VSDNEAKSADAKAAADITAGEDNRPEGESKAEGNAEPKPEADLETLRTKLADAQGEVLKVRDQLLRTAADFDNFRKRTRKDVEDAQRKGLEKALLEVLPVGDNLERAVQAAQQSGDLTSVVEGVTMVLRFFEDALSRLGAERVPAVGQGFDPSLHEAVQQVESDQPAGTVVLEMTPGYRLNGKLLRPAMVAVARAKASDTAPQTPLN
jgi:molecular chaperone GrpE